MELTEKIYEIVLSKRKYEWKGDPIGFIDSLLNILKTKDDWDLRDYWMSKLESLKTYRGKNIDKHLKRLSSLIELSYASRSKIQSI